jgi:Predicted acyl-CoA transferases/carnitine dehydratase
MKTGLGQHVDISKQEAEMAYNRVEIALYPNTGTIANRLAGRSTGTEVVHCKDSYVMPMAVLDSQWQALKEFMDNPKWAQDGKFDNFIGRKEYSPELVRRMGEEMENSTKEEIYHGGQAKGVPAAMVCSPVDVMNSPQYKARNFLSRQNTLRRER